MLSTKDLIYRELNSVLTTEYGTFQDKSVVTPVISYIETNNYDDKVGDNLFYSRITYQVKLWTYKVADIETYMPLIDNKMRALGFRRTNSYETVVDGLICKTTDFNAIGQEKI